MKAFDIAEIECRAPNGERVVTIIITSDMDDGGRIELAPLVSITPEAALENGETEFQLRENGRYYYDIRRDPGDQRDLRVRCHVAQRRRNLSVRATDAGRIETGNFCGTLLLEIVEGDVNDQTKPALANALVDVRSVKLDYRSEYRGMLRDLAGRMADLVADARSSAKTSFRSNFEERNDKGWFQVQLELLREVLESDEFTAALQRILAYPHERLEQELEMVPVERPFKWTPRAVQTLVNSPARLAIPVGHPLRSLTGLESAAKCVPVIRKAPTVDTPENRFIKHALQDFHGFLSRAQRLFEEAGGNWSAASGLARRLSLNVEQWLSRPFFKEVGELDVVPLGSPVLQRKAGYREILRWWLRFRTAAELSWHGGEDLFYAGQRNVADLYEYWLFFALLDWFCDRFNRNGQPPLIEQLVDGLEDDSPNLRLKKRVPLGPFSGNFSDPLRRLHASFSYNRAFKVTDARHESGSWTRKMHPDYTLTFWPAIEDLTSDAAAKIAEEQELLVHVHLDAKYRVDNLDALFGAEGSEDADEEIQGNYKRQDLLKMHAYRDAIKRSEGAYVLYPGDQQCRDGQYAPAESGRNRWPHTMRGFHEILPGLGAFAIAPDENGKAQGIDQIAKFFDELLENLCNRASLRERRTSVLHEALRERRALYSSGEQPDVGGLMLQEAPELDSDHIRLPSAAEIVVIVGWIKGDIEREWMESHKKVVLRLGDRRGALPLVKALAAASHVLLHGDGGLVLPGLWKIKPDIGVAQTRIQLESQGWPEDRSGGRTDDDLFAVFNAEPDSAFAQLEWEAAHLQRALTRFANRQRPAESKIIQSLGHRSAYVWLVSLADLQVALK